MNLFANDDTDNRFAVAALGELAIGGLAIALGWLIGPDARAFVPRWYDLRGLSIGLAAGIFFGVVFVGWMAIFSRLPLRSIQELAKLTEGQFLEYLMPMSRLQLLTLAITAGVGEELLFRGWLQSALIGPGGLDHSWSRIGFGVVIASIAFGMAHPISRTYVACAAMMGAMMGILYLITQNLLSSIVAHAVYDAIVLISMKRNAERGSRVGL